MAKRMIIVDERVYHQLIKPWNEAPTDNSKSHLNDQLESQLNSDAPDDIKAKLYQEHLSRFLNVKQKQPEQTLAPLNSIFEPHKKAVRRVRKPTGPKRVSRRKHIPWSRFADND
jgi:hypothetical protein